MDWSYSLLQPAEQAGVRPAGRVSLRFDAAAAAAVAAGDGVEVWDVRDALRGLVNKSMIATIAGGAGATRYQLLETMRQYARERLDESGDADRCRRAHAVYYEELAGDYSLAMLEGRELLAQTVDAFYREVDNLRAAVIWALDSPTPSDTDVALRIGALLAGVSPPARVAPWA